MRSYQIDELTQEQMDTINARFAAKGFGCSLPNLFQIPLPDNLMGPEQIDHATSCGPFYMAVETGKDWLRLEFLVRAREILRCSCVAYATKEQRDFMMEYIDTTLKEWDIPV
ncbi:MAG: hypothetical protein CSA21_01900 [Deltaproteobacteria bacterium]|nr:MAG: hypothetical protein CSA21_01900 [Deltaproteobacteria bacterium]